MRYHQIAEDVRGRIIAETKAKLAARRAFLESIIADADREMDRLDTERLDHFLAKHISAAELRDLEATEAQFQQGGQT